MEAQKGTSMKYLVTGCAGFIGWKVTEFLLAAEDTQLLALIT